MGPHTRRALHEALDLVLDAIAQDAREATGAPVLEAPKQRRTRAPKVRTLPPGVDDLTIRRALEAGRKAGLL